jgi:hypothetical protein
MFALEQSANRRRAPEKYQHGIQPSRGRCGIPSLASTRHTIRAILFASATAAIFVGRRSISPLKSWPSLGAMLLRVVDNGHCAREEQPSQVLITLLADTRRRAPFGKR